MKCLKEYIYNEKIKTLAEESKWIENDANKKTYIYDIIKIYTKGECKKWVNIIII